MQRSDLHGRRVLVVEDEYLLAEELSHVLAEAGARVLGPVAKVKAALELIRSDHGPEVAVLDMNLCGEMADPVAEALLESNVPFVLTTGYENNALPECYSGAPRMNKPIDTRSIIKALARLLD
jgi:DNA-binding NtrC family response regulator